MAQGVNHLAILAEDGKTMPCSITQMKYRRAEDDANAALISAAPDLLEACRQSLQVISEIADIDQESRAGWAHKELVNAIDKAEGEV